MSNTKTKIQVKWPVDGTFTIAQLQKANRGVINITLRFKLKKAIEAGSIVELGKNASKMGRPTLVFAQANPSLDLLASARASGVILNENYEKMIPSTVVVDFKKSETPSTEETYVETPSSIPTTVQS